MKKTLIVIILVLVVAITGCTNHASEENEKWCNGVKIVFFAGGAEDDVFANTVYNGARLAESDLGADVEYVWSDWNSESMVAQFKEQIDNNPDAIALMGHPGDEILIPFIDEAERKGIIVTAQNVDLEEAREKYVDNGFGYAGQVLYSSGFHLGKASAEEFGFGQGDEAIVVGLLNEAGRGIRTQGCIDGLQEQGVTVHYVEIPNDINADATSEASTSFFNELFDKYPDAKLLVIDHGSITSAAPEILKQLGKEPGDIIVTGFDLSSQTVEGIREGYIELISDQQPFLQGYLPILQVCLTKEYGFSGLYIDTGVGLVDRTNVDALANLAEQQIR